MHDKVGRFFKKNEAIPVADERIYFIDRGHIGLRELWGDSKYFGVLGSNRPFTRLEQVEFFALTDCLIYSFELEDLRYDDAAYRQIIKGFIDDKRYQGGLAFCSTILRADSRILLWLELTISEFGVDADRGRCLPFKITHKQIGAAIGTTRENVTIIIRKLKKDGMIKEIEGRIYLSQKS